MLYKKILEKWLSNQKKYLKYSTYTNYFNIIHNQIMPKLWHYDIDELKEEILQNFILEQIEHGRVDQTGGISHKYAKDIITVLKLTINHDFKICLPYERPKEVEIFDKENQITLINHLQSNITHKNFKILLCIHTGIRIGELCALKWGDINLASKLLNVCPLIMQFYAKNIRLLKAVKGQMGLLLTHRDHEHQFHFHFVLIKHHNYDVLFLSEKEYVCIFRLLLQQ